MAKDRTTLSSAGGWRKPVARVLAAVALNLVVAVCAGGQELKPLPFRYGEIAFAMRATKVNDFVGHAGVLRAEFEGEDLRSTSGFLELRVADMQTGIGLRDTHMRHAMLADSFPMIRFDLEGVDPGTSRGDTVDPEASRGDTIDVVFRGRLTIRGVSKSVRVPGSVILHQEAIDVIASTPIDMREYGIKPPTRFFGAIRVDPVTMVTATLRFGGK